MKQIIARSIRMAADDSRRSDGARLNYRKPTLHLTSQRHAKEVAASGAWDVGGAAG
jgi:hypothetical protein